MLTVFPLSQDNMLGFTLDGDIDDSGVSLFVTAVEAKVLTHGKVRLLGNIKNIGGFDSFRTFWDTLRTKKELWDKIEKYALLSDSSILDSAVSNLSWLAAHIEIKTFKLSEGEAAHEWLKAPIALKESKALKFVDLGQDNLLGLAIVDKMEVADYEKFNYYVSDKVEQYGKVRLFLEIVDMKGVSLRALYEDLKTAIKHYGSIERMAIIGDQSWLKGSVKVSDLLTPGLDMAAFGTDERARAIDWLK
ncbi:hypothetical protein CEQ90_11995 [Lewinellaceae bacterium SD302]|nr:hypothetical protein CEQ90_11995 [Lewinellaceae bacterium SD302]